MHRAYARERDGAERNRAAHCGWTEQPCSHEFLRLSPFTHRAYARERDGAEWNRAAHCGWSADARERNRVMRNRAKHCDGVRMPASES